MAAEAASYIRVCGRITADRLHITEKWAEWQRNLLRIAESGPQLQQNRLHIIIE